MSVELMTWEAQRCAVDYRGRHSSSPRSWRGRSTTPPPCSIHRRSPPVPTKQGGGPAGKADVAMALQLETRCCDRGPAQPRRGVPSRDRSDKVSFNVARAALLATSPSLSRTHTLHTQTRRGRVARRGGWRAVRSRRAGEVVVLPSSSPPSPTLPLTWALVSHPSRPAPPKF